MSYPYMQTENRRTPATVLQLHSEKDGLL